MHSESIHRRDFVCLSIPCSVSAIRISLLLYAAILVPHLSSWEKFHLLLQLSQLVLISFIRLFVAALTLCTADSADSSHLAICHLYECYTSFICFLPYVFTLFAH